MSLIKCSECGKEISNKARGCLNCGCPVEHNYKVVFIGYTATEDAAVYGIGKVLGIKLREHIVENISTNHYVLGRYSLEEAKKLQNN